MDNELLVKKLRDFKKYVEIFVKYHKGSVENIHKLRTSSRELFSLLSVDNMFYNRLKKVIKISNKIRDIDVFFKIYLNSLPNKYITKLDIKTITDSANKSREKKLDKLHAYLISLVIPDIIEFKYEEVQFSLMDTDEFSLSNTSELHKYRIFIKKRIYKEKNSSPRNEKKVKKLTRIKDLLGTINDNINGLNMLKSYNIKIELFKQIQDFTQNKNTKLFKEFLELDN